MHDPLPCFYSAGYEIPLPENHPFPMEKFSMARELLRPWEESGHIVISPVEACDHQRLLRVHSRAYLDAISQATLSPSEASRLGLPLGPALLKRCATETEGTRRAAWAALETGLAINLAGGTHHAFHDRGEGFCVLNDVVVAIQDLHAHRGCLRCMVIDTDAHQGNGTHALLHNHEDCFSYSIHVGANYPSQKVPGHWDVPLPRWVEGSEYLQALQETLPIALQWFQPDLVFWITGADPHHQDRFGQMRLTDQDLSVRHHFIMSLLQQAPTVVLYGGGYAPSTQATAEIHVRCLIDIIQHRHPARLHATAPCQTKISTADLDLEKSQYGLRNKPHPA